MTQAQRFDLIISGGGMVGQTLAALLSKMLPRLRLAIIEQQEGKPVQPASFDERVLALSAGSVASLRTLGIWQYISAFAEPITDIHISDRGHFGKVRMTAGEYGLAQLGAVIAAHQLGQGITQFTVDNSCICFFRPDSIEKTWADEGTRYIELESGQLLETPLLVVAEGLDSPTARQLQLEGEQHDYQQHAVIANLVTHLPHHGRAFERFTSNGPIALLPMTDNRRALVWTVAANQADEVMKLNGRDFIRRLQSDFGYRAGEILKVGKRSHYPLRFHHMTDPIRQRALVLGNAAHAVHPIAGQGFNLGLRDVLVLAELVRQAYKSSFDIGSEQLLQKYVSLREPDQQKVVQGTHLLALGFANSYLPAEVTRNLALMLIGCCSPLKRRLVGTAAGVNYRLVENEEGMHAEF